MSSKYRSRFRFFPAAVPLRLQHPSLSTLTSEHDTAIQAANDNAAAAKQIEAAYKVQIAALEVLGNRCSAPTWIVPTT